MAHETKQTTRKGSILLIAGVLLGALLGSMFMQLIRPHAAGELVARVTSHDEVVTVLPLSQEARQVVECEEGVNTVVVQDGGVHIEDADCKGGDCMKQGTIHDQGRLLVCLPHKLIVEIVPSDGKTSSPSVYTGEELVGSSEAPDIDAVVR